MKEREYFNREDLDGIGMAKRGIFLDSVIVCLETEIDEYCLDFVKGFCEAPAWSRRLCGSLAMKDPRLFLTRREGALLAKYYVAERLVEEEISSCKDGSVPDSAEIRFDPESLQVVYADGYIFKDIVEAVTGWAFTRQHAHLASIEEGRMLQGIDGNITWTLAEED